MAGGRRDGGTYHVARYTATYDSAALAASTSRKISVWRSASVTGRLMPARTRETT